MTEKKKHQDQMEGQWDVKEPTDLKESCSTSRPTPSGTPANELI